MTRVDVKLNRKGVAAYLRDPSVRKELERRAQAAARAAGPGYEASGHTGRRARASVITATPRAIIDNQRRQTLLRTMGGLR